MRTRGTGFAWPSGSERSLRSSARRGARGTTLVEMVVYAAILVILVGTCGLVLGAVQGGTHRTGQVARAQQAVAMGLHRIAREAREAPAGGVHLLDDGRGVADESTLGIVLASPRAPGATTPTLANGLPTWRKWVCYYVDAGRLYRTELDLSAVTVPPTPAAVRAGRPRTLIVDGLVTVGTQVAYDPATTRDPEGTDSVLITPHRSIGGVVSFDAEGFLAALWSTTITLDDDGNTASGSRPRLFLGVTATAGGLGTKRASDGSLVAVQSVFSSQTQAWVHNR